MKILEYAAIISIPVVFVFVGIIMLFSKRNLFSSFIDGAKEGLKTAIGLLPTLVALLSAIAMLRASGAIEYVSDKLSGPLSRLGVPSEIVPLIFTRPFSGSASSALFSDLLTSVGADSFAGMCAAVIMGSSDTVVYIISVYFSSVGIRKTRYAFPVAFAVMIFCLFFSCFICRIWFK